MPKNHLVPVTISLSLSACLAVPPEELASTSDPDGTSFAGTTETYPPIMTTTEGEPRDETSGEADEVTCEPGERESCVYGGPPGTLDVGPCAAAERECGEDGRWGACAGEVVPRAEDCRAGGDENCDGLETCDGEMLWAQRYGEAPGEAAGAVTPHALAVDPLGDAWLTGHFTGSLRLGESDWREDGAAGYLLAQLDGSGAPGFSFGDEQLDGYGEGHALASDGAGRIGFSAGYHGPLKVHPDSPKYTTAELTGAAVIGAVNVQGEYQWSRSLIPRGFGSVEIRGLAFDTAGELWAGGHIALANVDLETAGEPLLVKNAGGYDALLLRIDRGGEIAWVGRFGDAQDQRIHDVAVDAFGDVWIVGEFAGLMQFAGGSLQAAASEKVHRDMFVVKLDAAGKWKWGRVYGDERDQRFLRVEVDAEGNGLVFGEYMGALTGLDDTLPAADSPDSLVVAKLDPDGAALWVKGWRCAGKCALEDAVVDGAGQSVVSASIEPGSTLTINAEPFAAGEVGTLGVVAKLDRAGFMLWYAEPFPAAVKLAAGPLGELFVAGEFYEQATLGDGAFHLYAGDNDLDMYVAKLRP